MELILNTDWLSIYIDSIQLSIDIPMWVAVGTVGLVYAIKLLKKE